jgi:hypothetical protein
VASVRDIESLKAEVESLRNLQAQSKGKLEALRDQAGVAGGSEELRAEIARLKKERTRVSAEYEKALAAYKEKYREHFTD